MTIERPMLPPVDQTRRRLLSQSAGVIAGGAALALVAIPPASTAAAPASPLDPIYAAIEAHRRCCAASSADSDEVERLIRLADEIAGPRKIDIPSMIEPGTTVKASDWLDIEQAIPSAQYPEQYAHYIALLKDRAAARNAVTGDLDQIGEESYAAEFVAVRDFADTVPTTLGGLLAMMVYASEMGGNGLDYFDGNLPIIGTMAAAAKQLCTIQTAVAS